MPIKCFNSNPYDYPTELVFLCPFYRQGRESSENWTATQFATKWIIKCDVIAQHLQGNITGELIHMGEVVRRGERKPP